MGKNLTQSGVAASKAEKERTKIRETLRFQRREVTEKSAKQIELSCKWDAKNTGKSGKDS
jgi:hypothetical protein